MYAIRSYYEGGGVVEESSEAGEGEDAVVAQQGDVEQRVGGARLELQEEPDPRYPGKCRSGGPGAAVEVGGTADQQQDGGGVVV